MKSVVVLLSFLAVATFARAQSNLQINQALRFKASGSFSNSTPSTAGTITVPSGMMFKIESASASGGGCTLLLDEQLVFISYATDAYASQPSFPIWLGPGTYTVTYTNTNIDVTSGTYYCVVSGLEFNMVQ